MTYMFNAMHYCLQMCLKILEISVLKHMDLILLKKKVKNRRQRKICYSNKSLKKSIKSRINIKKTTQSNSI